ncbi:hypothetical protein [Chryseobacterium sp.]|uniref:hypothetical protein n=1 Tax=Chryseobacterium sp. TaxID=1871047 RepID=UPI0012A9085F|nr:hypothetical protein [Chryseobacterium sp.]QFG53461.1 hypothetical protein F7R58_07830 [Chryseobacterium sp.]
MACRFPAKTPLPLKPTMEHPPIFLSIDQPATCPHFGNRTDITAQSERSQRHKCLSELCGFQFILEQDEEEER